ncbi:MAG: response regulator, partial [Chlamydiia bacterium]|nr:response regulator [Chlamydiia bacterium]
RTNFLLALFGAFIAQVFQNNSSVIFILTVGMGADLVASYQKVRQLFRILRKSKEDAENETRERNRYLVHLNQEMRIPISGLIGMSHSLLETKLSPHQKRLVHGIAHSSETLSRSVREVLELSKIGLYQNVSSENIFNMTILVEEAINLFETAFFHQQRQIEWSVAEEFPPLTIGDVRMLEELFIKVIQYTSQFSHVLSVDCWGSPYESTVDMINLVVQIKAVGSEISELPPEAVSQDKSLSKHPPLSLEWIRQRVSQLRGELTILNDEENDLEIYFTVPIKIASLRNQTEKIIDLLSGCKACVIESDPVRAEMIASSLEQFGITCELVFDLEEIEVCIKKSCRCDLLLIRHDPPKIDLWEVIKSISKDKESNHEKNRQLIVAMTSRASELKASSLVFFILVDPIDSPQIQSILTKFMVARIPQLPIAEKGNFQLDQLLKCLLIVDEDPINQLVFKNLLSKTSENIFVAESQKQAIEVIKENEVTVTLVSCSKTNPKIIEWIRLIRKTEKERSKKPTFLIICSSQEDDANLGELMAAEINARLTYPINENELIGLLRQASKTH